MEKAATMKVLANGSWKLPQGRFEEKSHHSKTTNNQKTFLAIKKKMSQGIEIAIIELTGPSDCSTDYLEV